MGNILKHPPNSLMKEEIFATHLATAVLFSVLGVQISDRESVNKNTRQVLEILFLSIAMFIILWAALSYYGLLLYKIHRVGLFLIILLTLSAFSYVVYLSSKEIV